MAGESTKNISVPNFVSKFNTTISSQLMQKFNSPKDILVTSIINASDDAKDPKTNYLISKSIPCDTNIYDEYRIYDKYQIIPFPDQSTFAPVCLTDRHFPNRISNPDIKHIPDRAIFANLDGKNKYKPVACKIRPVIGELPDKFHIIHDIIGDPFQNLPVLPSNPPPFAPRGRYTQEQKKIFDMLNPGFLLLAERDLMHYFMTIHEDSFA